MSDFIKNALRQSSAMYAMQSLSPFEVDGNGEPKRGFALGKQYAAETIGAIRAGASCYLMSVVVVGVSSMKDEALIHGLCSGLDEAFR